LQSRIAYSYDSINEKRHEIEKLASELFSMDKVPIEFEVDENGILHAKNYKGKAWGMVDNKDIFYEACEVTE